MKNNKVAILLATYNGEHFLKEQLDSIISQKYKDFVIYIRDDNSTDNTIKIIKEYVKKYPKKVICIEDNKNANGAFKNFMYLLEYVYNLKLYEIYMFSDQDDVWLDNKVSDTVKTYLEVNNRKEPILIHTDLEVVDCNLNVINKSFFKYSNLKSKYNKPNNYLIQNNVTGNTVCINNSLVELIKFDIQNMRMHDWYFALLASAFGKVIYIDKAYVKYRQHNQNVIGAKHYNIIGGVYRKLLNNTIKKDLEELFLQAKSFKKHYYKLLDDNNKKIIDDFCRIPNRNKFEKIKIINRNKFYKHSILRIIGEFIFI